jgi:16S rRNA (guanine1207-N2)-methyltransferase
MTDDPEESAPDHYFSERPRSASRPSQHRFLYRGKVLSFEADRGVFGIHGLDPGTALLIESMTLEDGQRILDLGCGWGALGIAAARAAPAGQVILTDVNRRAIVLTRHNLRRNQIRNAEVRAGSGFAPVAGERFDAILTNPPYHVGRPFVLALLAEAPAYLTDAGKLWIVGKGSQGIRFYQEWLESHWTGTVEVAGRRSGYRVLVAGREPPNRQA